MKPEIFIQKRTVLKNDIDALGHVNNIVYLQWCLDGAEAHWISKTTIAQQEKYVWVVLQHTIDYKAPAFKNDTIEIQTWVEKSEGVKSLREYVLKNKATNTVLVKAKTLWCLLDSTTKRPIKIPEDITHLFHQK